VLSVYTSSVAKAYLLPLRGLEGAGEGGRSCPSRSSLEKALPSDFPASDELDAASLPFRSSAEPDIVVGFTRRSGYGFAFSLN